MTTNPGRFNSLLQFSSPGKGSQTNQTLQNLVVNDVKVSGAGFGSSDTEGVLQGHLNVEKTANLSLQGSETVPTDSRGILAAADPNSRAAFGNNDPVPNPMPYEVQPTDRIIPVDLFASAGNPVTILLGTNAQQGQIVTVMTVTSAAGDFINVDAGVGASMLPAGPLALGNVTTNDPVSGTWRYDGTQWTNIAVSQAL